MTAPSAIRPCVPVISLIAAVAANGVIGRDGGLPWRLPADLRRFKDLTMGKPILMGRKTWLSLGRPLPGRRNIVLTRDAAFRADGAVVAHAIDEALCAAESAEEIMVIGGAEVYRALLPPARRLYLTEVKARVEGDARFPAWDRGAWREISREEHAADERHAHAFSFVVLERR